METGEHKPSKMKTKKQDILLFAVMMSLTAALGVYIHCTQGFTLAFREQCQLFLFDGGHAWNTIVRAGGLTDYLSQFAVQFFYIHGIGAAVTALLAGAMSLFLWTAMRKADCSWVTFPLCFLPALWTMVSLLEDSFSYNGLVAMVFCCAFLSLYALMPPSLGWRKTVAGAALTAALYCMGGAIALLFAATALVFDIVTGSVKRTFSWTFVIVAAALGVATVLGGGEGSFRYVFTPEAYMNHTVPFRPIHHVAWLTLPLSLALSRIVTVLPLRNIYAKSAACALLFAATTVTFCLVYKKNIRTMYERAYELDFYAERGEWDKIVDKFGDNSENFVEANYLNLALAKKGLLTDKLLEYNNSGPLSLIFYPKDLNYIQLVMGTRVLLSMGNLAGAQSLASDADQSVGGHNPQMLKMLVQMELMRGCYKVAEKYIGLLSHTWQYAGWAESQRKYLYNDKLVMADKTLGTGRRDLPKEEAFVLYDTPMDDLYKILDTNPADKTAMDYGLSYLVLSKDIYNIVLFVERYYGKGALRQLPACAQEALVFCADYYGGMEKAFALEHGMGGDVFDKLHSIDINWCRRHGVEENTEERYSQFKEAGKMSQSNPSALLAHRYTFWYYMLVNQN